MFKSIFVVVTLLLLCPENYDAVENIEVITYNTTSNNSEELKDINEVISIFIEGSIYRLPISAIFLVMCFHS